MQVRVVEFAFLFFNYVLIRHFIVAQKLCREKPPNDMVSCTKEEYLQIANFFAQVIKKYPSTREKNYEKFMQN